MSFATFAIVCPMVFLAGIVDAIGGGGGLISLPAYLIAGLPAHSAVATNKFSSSIGTLVSTVRYCLNGYVDWLLALPGIICSVAGAQVGSRLALMVDDKYFKIVLLVLVPAIGIYTLLKKDLEPRDTFMPRKKQMVLVAILSLVMGTYDGFYGPGTGTFLLLVYTGICKMNMKAASGNMKLANLASNLSALVVFLINGKVMLPLGAAAACFSIAGHYIGAGLAMKKGAKFVRIVILCVLVLLIVKMGGEYLGWF